MSVYVDNERNRFGRMVMCHMFADTPAELHDMATRIGMRRAWYQTPDGPNRASFPRYDVCLMRRAKAIQMGAIEVDRRQGYEIRKAIRRRIIDEDGFAASWRFAA